MAQEKKSASSQLAMEVLSSFQTDDTNFPPFSATLLKLIFSYHELRSNVCHLGCAKNDLAAVDMQFEHAQNEAALELRGAKTPEVLEGLFDKIRGCNQRLILLATQTPKNTDTEISLHTPDLIAENIRMVGALFPSCLTETLDEEGNSKAAINFDLLRQALNDEIVEGSQERYELNWPGKRQALLNGCLPTAKTLRPVPEDSVNFETTQNIFIEGDNLEALKLILESYRGKVKMIYIDPPYNTGTDRIYKDNFAENAVEYLANSEQTNGLSERLATNPDSNGRFHSNWLSMMYPRLEMAKRLLADDGVIFISCDDSELHNLRKLLDLVFGSENYVETYSWVKTSTPPSLSPKSRQTIEYILCYEKNRSNLKYRGCALDNEDQPLLNKGNQKRTLKFPKDKVFFSFERYGKINAGEGDRAKLVNDLSISNGYSDTDILLEGEFKWQQSFLDDEIKKGTTFIIKSRKLAIRFLRKTGGFKAPTNRIKDDIIIKTLEKCGTNETGSKEIQQLFGESVFSNPKPSTLIQYLLNFLHISDDEIILDFFAGSGTTAHAVMKLNANDGANRRCLSIQLQEKIDDKDETHEAAYSFCTDNNLRPTIAEVAKERIRRAGTTILENNCHPDWNKDIGFRVLKIDSSNYHVTKRKLNEITQKNILESIDNIKSDRSDVDLLFEVLMREGMDLSLPVETKTQNERTVYFVDGTALIACFDKAIPKDLIAALIALKPEKIAFRDHSFARDADRVNMTLKFTELSPSTIIKVI